MTDEILILSEIKWGKRQRSDYGDIQVLAADIARLGLINPIVIGDKNELIAGGRRLTALAVNGVVALEEGTHFRRLQKLTEIEKQEIELSENLKRKDLTFAEEVAAKQKLHSLRVFIAEKEGKKWAVEDTALELNQGKDVLMKDLKLASDIQKHPELAKVTNKAEAMSKARRLDKEFLRSLTPIKANTKNVQLIHGDCTDEMKNIKTDSVDLILADPPFGINLHTDTEFNKTHPEVYGDYEDTVDALSFLLENALAEMYRVLKPGGHCYLFFAFQHFSLVKQEIKKAEFTFQNSPLIWAKQTNQNHRPHERFTINYEPFWFMYKKPQKELTKPSMAIFNVLTETCNKQHAAQKPSDLYEILIELSSMEGDLILDPFLGSGKSLKCALDMNRRVIGIESVKKHFDLARENILQEGGDI